MEEANTETPTQPEVDKGISFEKFWFIPVILALIAIMVVGILWVTNRGLLAPKPSPSPVPTASPSAEVDESTAALEGQGTSDEISEIETDLEATDLTNIDKELTDIEAELSSP